MEKFGIFELLDALSALTAPDAGQPPSEPSDPFAPPDYSAPAPSQKEHGEPGDRDALAGFYARHEKIAKKAGRPPKTMPKR